MAWGDQGKQIPEHWELTKTPTCKVTVTIETEHQVHTYTLPKTHLLLRLYDEDPSLDWETVGYNELKFKPSLMMIPPILSFHMLPLPFNDNYGTRYTLQTWDLEEIRRRQAERDKAVKK